MSNTEDLDFELIEDDDIIDDDIEIETDEEATPSGKTKEGSGEDTTPAKGKKKNTSNFKKLAKINKALKEENRLLREGKSKVDPTEPEDDDDEPYVSSTEMRLFIVENPEAKEYKEAIETIIEESKGTLGFERAFTLAKAEKPKESEDEDDFKTKGSNVKVKKRLIDLTEEEALKLPNNKYLEYQRKKGKLK